MDTIKEGKTAAQIIEDLIVNHTKEKLSLLEQLRKAQEQNAKMAVATQVISKIALAGVLVIGIVVLEKKANKK